jgi:hypothetical protein
MRDYPYPMADGTRSIALGIIFSLLTCGIYSLYWQYKQMATLSPWCLICSNPAPRYLA